MIQEQVTLIIILHNRHKNLDRLLRYYQGNIFPIIVADSSHQPHQFEHSSSKVKYCYTPNFSYTEKVERVLSEVKTPYVALCADDDFIIPEGLFSCAAYLSLNSEYTAAQGKILKFFKNSLQYQIRFETMYEGAYNLVKPSAADRLTQLFDDYKSLLYAVHRTDILKKVFSGAGMSLRNLYLNEYLVSILPVLYGKTADLPILYQCREYTEDSDDKVTHNLDIIFSDPAYKQEINSFLDYLALKEEGKYLPEARQKIFAALHKYAQKLPELTKPSNTIEKKLGRFLQIIPFLGDYVLRKYRLYKSKSRLKSYLSQSESRELVKIAAVLKQYSFNE